LYAVISNVPRRFLWRVSSRSRQSDRDWVQSGESARLPRGEALGWSGGCCRRL